MNKIAKIPYWESEMSQFTRCFSGKFLDLENYAGIKHLTNIMSGEIRKANLNCQKIFAFCLL